ncbi:hypothetical protein NUSPORA_01956 [Nucleospora cyclopteri]
MIKTVIYLIIWIIHTTNDTSKNTSINISLAQHQESILSTSQAKQKIEQSFLDAFLEQYFSIDINFIFTSKIVEMPNLIFENSIFNIFDLCKIILIDNNRSVEFEKVLEIDKKIDQSNFTYERKFFRIDYMWEKKNLPNAYDSNELAERINNFNKLGLLVIPGDYKNKLDQYKRMIKKSFFSIQKEIKNCFPSVYISLKWYNFYKQKYIECMETLLNSPTIDDIQLESFKNIRIYVIKCINYFSLHTMFQQEMNFLFSLLKSLNLFRSTILDFDKTCNIKFSSITNDLNEIFKGEPSLIEEKVTIIRQQLLEDLDISIQSALKNANEKSKELEIMAEKTLESRKLLKQIDEKNLIEQNKISNLYVNFGSEISKLLVRNKILNTEWFKKTKNTIKNSFNSQKTKLDIENQLVKIHAEFWKFIKTEKHTADKIYYNEFMFQQYFYLNINFSILFQAILAKTIDLECNIVESRIKVWKQLLDQEFNIYLNLKHNYFEKILELESALRIIIDNELKLIELWNTITSVSDLEKARAHIIDKTSLEHNIFVANFDVIMEEFKLKKKGLDIQIFQHQILMEYKLKTNYLLYIHFIYDQANILLKNRYLKHKLITTAFFQKFNSDSSDICMLLSVFENTILYLKQVYTTLKIKTSKNKIKFFKTQLNTFRPDQLELIAEFKAFLHEEQLNLQYIENHKKSLAETYLYMCKKAKDETEQHISNKIQYNSALLNFRIQDKQIENHIKFLNTNLTSFLIILQCINIKFDEIETYQHKHTRDIQQIRDLGNEIINLWTNLAAKKNIHNDLILYEENKIKIQESANQLIISEKALSSNLILFYNYLNMYITDQTFFSIISKMQFAISNMIKIVDTIEQTQLSMIILEKNTTDTSYKLNHTEIENLITTKMQTLLFTANNMFLSYIYHNSVIQQFKGFILDLDSISKLILKNLRNTQNYLKDFKCEISLLNEKDLTNAQKNHNNWINFCFQILKKYQEYKKTNKTIYEMFQKSKIILELHFKKKPRKIFKEDVRITPDLLIKKSENKFFYFFAISIFIFFVNIVLIYHIFKKTQKPIKR